MKQESAKVYIYPQEALGGSNGSYGCKYLYIVNVVELTILENHMVTSTVHDDTAHDAKQHTMQFFRYLLPLVFRIPAEKVFWVGFWGSNTS